MSDENGTEQQEPDRPEVVRFLSAEDILLADDIPYETVEVKEWGGILRVRGMTGAERDSYESGTVSFDDRGRRRLNLVDARARVMARTVVDGEGHRLFTEAQVKTLSKKSAVALEKVSAVALRLSGMTAEDLDAAAKNSDGAETDPSQNGADGSDTHFATASP